MYVLKVRIGKIGTAIPIQLQNLSFISKSILPRWRYDFHLFPFFQSKNLQAGYT